MRFLVWLIDWEVTQGPEVMVESLIFYSQNNGKTWNVLSIGDLHCEKRTLLLAI